MSSISDRPPANPLGQHLIEAARYDAGSTASEDSAMFTLDKLMADAVAGPTSSGFAQDEDSGLIDLNALGPRPFEPSPRPAPTPWLGPGEFPLGAPATAPAPPQPSDASTARPKRQGAMLMYGLATTALLLLAAVVFLLVRGPTGLQATAATDTAVAAGRGAPIAQQPTTSPTAVTSGPADSSPASPSSDAAPSATPSGTEPGIAQRPRPSPSPIPAKPASTAPPAGTATTPSNGTSCPCPKDDLMCHMHCSVKK